MASTLVRLLLPLLVLALAACAGAQTAPGPQGWPADQPRTDEQGEVSVTITPLAFAAGDAELGFEISLDTHSVELNIDLTALATLTTDTGFVLAPNGWEGPQGGHHMSGILTFPLPINISDLWEGATQITLMIRSIDGFDRSFVWNLE
ncbi:MAG: hypothetical protein WD751_04570 [Anaerolineales bacterium]